jgi:hypothetical protein
MTRRNDRLSRLRALLAMGEPDAAARRGASGREGTAAWDAEWIERRLTSTPGAAPAPRP